ncbi:MAG: HD-GYP domain-containing protein [Spirochaetota bacterium]
MDQLHALQELFCELDSRRDIGDKLAYLTSWPIHQLGATEARLICVDEANTSPCPQSVSFFPRERLAGLPGERSVINGHSEPVARAFHGSAPSRLTVHVPIHDDSEGIVGSLLLKTDSPRHFLKRHGTTLSLMSSKAKELLERRMIEDRLNTCKETRNSDADMFGPETLARLMDLVGLPMYVASHDGTFLSANAAFLNHFNYDDVGTLNTDDEFFVHTESWEQQMRRLAQAERIETVEVKVRAGDGSIRVARDHSTLIGKNTFGILIDLTNYVEINDSLEKALSDQRTLSDKFKSTTEVLQKTQATAMKSLAKLAEFRDKETGNHLQRICTYMRMLATELHARQPYHFTIGPNYADDIYVSGMLHDIGKVAIPDTILLKPASLDQREWEMMKKHSQFGWSILHEADQELGEQSFLTLASRIALYHHERYDGTGYPHGLSGEDIPLSARIAAIADVYDALTSDRPYKSAWSHHAAVREIEAERGRHFDPVIADIFIDIQDRFLAVQTQSADQPELLN